VARKAQPHKKESPNTVREITSLNASGRPSAHSIDHSQPFPPPDNAPPRIFSGVTFSTDTDASPLKLAIGSFPWSLVRSHPLPYSTGSIQLPIVSQSYSTYPLQAIQHTHGPRSTTLTSTARRDTLPTLESTKHYPRPPYLPFIPGANVEPVTIPYTILLRLNFVRHRVVFRAPQKIAIHRTCKVGT
jgi:hypothetical protein